MPTAAQTQPSIAPDAHTMQCMEVWGGNQAIDNGVIMPGLDLWVFSRPYKGDAGGGDVHYVSSCATGRITRLLVADVSGHGQSVADIALTLRQLMRRYINYTDQTRFVQSLNKEFSALAEEGRFATAVVATYWAPTHYLVACNAGHPRPLWYRGAKKSWELLRAPEAGAHDSDGLVNLPLGIAEPTGYDQFGVKLATGDLVIVYTDSLIESRGPDGRLLGEAGLLEIVRSLDVSQPEQLIARLVGRVMEHASGAPPEDDVTVLLLRDNGVALRNQTGLGLLAPFRIGASAVRALFSAGKSPAGIPEISIANIVGAVVPPVSKLWKPRTKRR